MSTYNDVQVKQSENVVVEEMNQRERLVLQMFRQLDQQQQKDILRFIEVLTAAK
ncbi:hypothetical protein [Pseudomonas veronii]|jgi:hypothetical protein|uniref:hypothetical protein n=1 Tax=Pseudomonas veronii TaxID=76761 RepID=UPI00163BCFED|nr:hypothetical protein [Pseudomonas veronii]